MKTVGIYNPNLNTKGGGEKVCLFLAQVLAKRYKVSVITHTKVNKKELEEYFDVNLKDVDFVVFKTPRWIKRASSSRFLTGALRNLIRDASIYRKLKTYNFDVFMNNAYNTEIPSPAPTGVYLCMFPHKLIDVSSLSSIKKIYVKIVGLISRLAYGITANEWLDTYQSIISISHFTRTYVTEYWNRDSQILYPVCDDVSEPGVDKQKIILNVGRLFYNNGVTHHKRQDFLLKQFIKQTDLHKAGWQLHFAGTVNENYHDASYALELIKKADGYPVYFHFDMPRDRLRQLFNQASIYWHATGYGSNASKFPERQEHFGIVTVEAMSTGAVPVVIDTAGQQEIVQEGHNGYLWTNAEGLVSRTEAAIKNHKALSSQARKDSIKYDRHAFGKRVEELFQF